MKPKKNPAANLEKQRWPLILLGLAISASTVVSGVTFLSFDEEQNMAKAKDDGLDDEVVPDFQPPPPPDEPPPPPDQAPPPQIEEIVEVEDDEEIDDVEIIIAEDPTDVVSFTPPPDEPEPPKEVIIYDVVSEMPEFPGGEEELYKFLGDNLKYPAMARESNIQGRVWVGFVVYEDGSIKDIQVLKGIGGGCDEEAVRVVKMMPNWTPGEQMGKKVPVKFRLPINFKLN